MILQTYKKHFKWITIECNAARCDDVLGHCVIGIYDETKGCTSNVKTQYEIKEKGTPSKYLNNQVSLYWNGVW